MEEIIALHSEAGPSGYKPYVLELGDGILDAEMLCPQMCLVVMKRLNGLLLALPAGALSEETAEQGQLAEPADLIGPSHLIEVGAELITDWESLARNPLEHLRLEILLVDFAPSVMPLLKDVATFPDLEAFVKGFGEDIAHMPDAQEIVDVALEWIANPLSTQRVGFYSAEEDVPEIPLPGTSEAGPKAKVRARVPNGGGPPGAEPGRPKKKATVASLADSVEQILTALPALNRQIEELSLRQDAMEQSPNLGRPSALRQPLGSFPSRGSSAQPPLSNFVKEMPPPRSSTQKERVATTSKHVDLEAAELAEEKGLEGSSDLARAVLAQSQALTALVSQIAGSTSDPIHDLAAASSVSSRGAAGRAKLQQELSAQKGTFYAAVMQNISRRMQPSQPSDLSMTAMRDRGVTATRYLERFGGYGKVKEMGHIAWQLGLVMDYLQDDNMAATKDAVALLMVCVEQIAMDAGRTELGLLLTLAEEPPQSLFSNRSLAAGARPMAFAPLADQRWVTTSLQYLKELDTIATRRNDGGPKKEREQNPDKSNTGNPASKKKAKGGGKGKQRTEEDHEG